MPPTDHLLTFVITAFVLIIIPGPSVLFTIGRALTVGRRGALLSAAGNSAGAYLQVIAVAVGIGTLVQRSTEIYTATKFVGAAYLVFLGVLVGVANPKTIIFFTVAMPQFVDRGAGHVPLQLLVLGAVFPAIALVSDSVWALVAGTARSWLARSPRRLSAIGGAGGLAIVGLGVTVAVTGGKD